MSSGLNLHFCYINPNDFHTSSDFSGQGNTLYRGGVFGCSAAGLGEMCWLLTPTGLQLPAPLQTKGKAPKFRVGCAPLEAAASSAAGDASRAAGGV